MLHLIINKLLEVYFVAQSVLLFFFELNLYLLLSILLCFFMHPGSVMGLLM